MSGAHSQVSADGVIKGLTAFHWDKPAGFWQLGLQQAGIVAEMSYYNQS